MASYANGVIPNNNVSITDVRQTLGLSNTQQWNSVGHLCVSDNVNMWSLNKPADYGAGGMYDLTDFQRAKAGFAISNTNPKVLIRNMPKGGVGSPYRLGDFRLYKHKALGLSIIRPTLKASMIERPLGQSSPPLRAATFNLTISLPEQISIGSFPVSSNYIPAALIKLQNSSLGNLTIGQKMLDSNNISPGMTHITIPCHIPNAEYNTEYTINLGFGLGNSVYDDSITAVGVTGTTLEYYVGSENTNMFTIRTQIDPEAPVSGSYFTKDDFYINSDIQLIITRTANGSTIIQSKVLPGGNNNWGTVSGSVRVYGFDANNGDAEVLVGRYSTPTFSTTIPKTLSTRFELRAGF